MNIDRFAFASLCFQKSDVKNTAFQQHLQKLFSTNTLHSVCPWLQNMVSMELGPGGDETGDQEPGQLILFIPMSFCVLFILIDLLNLDIYQLKLLQCIYIIVGQLFLL